MQTEKNNSNKASSVNRAKFYQLALFPMNNGATNVYYILTLNFIAYYANGVLGLLLIFATTIVTAMRILDAFTDPIIGAIIDRTSTRFGKFRPFMLLGNIIMMVASVFMYFGIRLVPEQQMGLRYATFILFYVLYVIGYTFQTACTRSGQTCLTNDPKQRPLFTVFNTIASLIGMGLVQFLAPILSDKLGGYNSADFFDFMIPLAIVVSFFLTILAIIGIREKDNEAHFGLGNHAENVEFKEYVSILKANKALQRLMVAGAGSKLAFSIATNMTVLCMLYGSMMGDYGRLYLPMMIVGYIFSVPFFLLTVKTSQKHGQKKSLVRFTKVSIIMYIGVLVLLFMWNPNVASRQLSLVAINPYTVMFILFFGIGYGSYYATADMAIPMVADCSDYETYRSGRYIPGIMGTLFSLVDKMVSSLGSTIVGITVSLIGIRTLPDGNTPYMSGMHTVVIILFCIVPMMAWALTLIAMKGYHLTGAKMEEIQSVNAFRKEALERGETLQDVMEELPITEGVL